MIEQKGVNLMDYISIEEILTEQPPIYRKIKYKRNIYKLINTTHNTIHGDSKDLTCYTYRNEAQNQNLLFFCNKGKIVDVETKSGPTLN